MPFFNDSFWSPVKKPNLPVFIPKIGIPESFIYVIDLRIVPSPPIENKKSWFVSIFFEESKKDTFESISSEK